MVLRETSANEALPTIVKEGKPVKEFEQDFFIVSLGHGQPKTNKDFNILKNHDFPVGNRGKPVTKTDFKDYIKRHAKEPSQRKFASFHLLLYIAELMDIDTALSIAEKVGREEALDPALVELLESI